MTELNHCEQYLPQWSKIGDYQCLGSPHILINITVRFHRRAVLSDSNFRARAGMNAMDVPNGRRLSETSSTLCYFLVGLSPPLGPCPLLSGQCISYAHARLVTTVLVLLSPLSFIVQCSRCKDQQNSVDEADLISLLMKGQPWRL